MARVDEDKVSVHVGFVALEGDQMMVVICDSGKGFRCIYEKAFLLRPSIPGIYTKSPSIWDLITYFAFSSTLPESTRKWHRPLATPPTGKEIPPPRRNIKFCQNLKQPPPFKMSNGLDEERYCDQCDKTTIHSNQGGKYICNNCGKQTITGGG